MILKSENLLKPLLRLLQKENWRYYKERKLKIWHLLFSQHFALRSKWKGKWTVSKSNKLIFLSRFWWLEVKAKTSDVRSGHTGDFYRKPRPDLIVSFSRALIWCIYQLCSCNGSDFMERLIKSLPSLVFENIAAIALWTLWRIFYVLLFEMRHFKSAVPT